MKVLQLQKKTIWICKKYGIEPEAKIINEIIDRSNGNIRTLDDLMQQAVDGSYKSYEDMTQDEKFFGRRLLFENWNLQKTFKEADQIEDYPGMAVGMCRYAVGVLKNSNNEKCKKFVTVNPSVLTLTSLPILLTEGNVYLLYTPFRGRWGSILLT